MPDSLEPLTVRSLIVMALGFLSFLALLWLGSEVLPGRIEKGVVLPDGSRRSYKLNGLYLLLIVILIVATARGLGFSLSYLPRNVFAALVVANVFALSLSLLLYVRGRASAAGSEKEGASQGIVRGLYYGIEGNPTWFGIDLKFFSYRPSLIGLGLFNVSFACLQYERHGVLTNEMITYQLMYFGYIANYFQFEYGMIFTWDIIQERFGGMLVWGDYVYVPFFYSLPGWYLVDRLTPLPTGALVGIVVLYLVGFWLFRGANEQKHAFRRTPATTIWGKRPHVVGGRLLAAGFWGIGRKLNYTGEWYTYALQPVLRSAGGALVRGEPLRASGALDGMQSTRVLGAVQSWLARGLVDPNLDDAAFTTGRAALSWSGHWDYTRYAEALGEDLAVLPLPNFGTGTRTGQGSWLWTIPRTSGSSEAVAELLRFLLEPDEVLRMARANGAVPGTRTAAVRSQIYGPGGPLSLFLRQLTGGTAVPRPRSPLYPVLSSLFQEAFDAIRENEPVERVLRETAEQVDREIEDNRGYPRL